MEIKTEIIVNFTEKERFAIELVADLIADILIWEDENNERAIPQISVDDLETASVVLEDMLYFTKEND